MSIVIYLNQVNFCTSFVAQTSLCNWEKCHNVDYSWTLVIIAVFILIFYVLSSVKTFKYKRCSCTHSVIDHPNGLSSLP